MRPSTPVFWPCTVPASGQKMRRGGRDLRPPPGVFFRRARVWAPPKSRAPAPRLGAPLVAGQLDKTAAAPAALRDRPFEHPAAAAAAALAGSDPHPLDLAAPHAAPGQAGDEAELQNAHYAAAARGDREQLIRIAF